MKVANDSRAPFGMTILAVAFVLVMAIVVVWPRLPNNGDQNIPDIVEQAAASSGATAARPGFKPPRIKFNMFYGGTGGGGGNQTAGGNAGAGGDGDWGCGGGGAGGATTTNTTLARPGDGGPGFVVIACF